MYKMEEDTVIQMTEVLILATARKYLRKCKTGKLASQGHIVSTKTTDQQCQIHREEDRSVFPGCKV